jgi:hypothetical protein
MKKPFPIALGLVAVTVAACGGKVVVESSGASGTGGAGGTTTTFTTGDGAPNTTANVAVSVSVAAVTSVTSVAAATSVTTGTGSDCDPTYTCAQAIAPDNGDPTKLCENTLAGKIYYGLVQCVCVDTCAVQCAESACAGFKPGPTCMICLQDTANGCGMHLADCTNN